MYARKVLPFLKIEYFQDNAQKIVFQKIQEFIVKYNKNPTHEALAITINNLEKIKEDDVKEAISLLTELKKSQDEKPNDQWLIDNSEAFCQERAIYNAVRDSIDILDDKKGAKGNIPKLLADALSVSFDTHVGHDYIEDAQERYEYYHRIENKIAFDLDYLNRITNGGITPKTLNIIMGGIHVGKTLILCHLAAGYLAQGKNVLYITLEMEEQKIAMRIDANLLNLMMEDIESVSKPDYEKRIAKLKNGTQGKIIIKEYPTASASVVNFRALLNELNLKINFKPDVVMIDYLNICASCRIKDRAMLYQYVKSVAEEIRGLAVEFGVPIWSATQLNRDGFGSSDIDLTDTSESFGLPATADFLLAIQTSDELEQLGQYAVKQLKNRYGDITKNKRFILGVDRAKMRLYDTDQSSQEDLVDLEEGNSPKFDKTTFGKRQKELKGLKV